VDDLPDEWCLRFNVVVALFWGRELFCQSALQVCVVLSVVGMGAKELTEQESELLGEGARAPHVDVGTALAGLLAEVSLGALGVTPADPS
jgi:hypothetical protein